MTTPHPFQRSEYWAEVFAADAARVAAGGDPHLEDVDPAEEPAPAALAPVRPPVAERLFPQAEGSGGDLLRLSKGMPYLSPEARPQPPVAGEESDPAAADWLREIALALVEYSERIVREALRRRGLAPREIAAWLKAARQASLDDYLAVDVDERRATLFDKADAAHEAAVQAMDVKGRLTAVKLMAQIAGVLSDGGGGGGDFASIVKRITQGDVKASASFTVEVDGRTKEKS